MPKPASQNWKAVIDRIQAAQSKGILPEIAALCGSFRAAEGWKAVKQDAWATCKARAGNSFANQQAEYVKLAARIDATIPDLMGGYVPPIVLDADPEPEGELDVPEAFDLPATTGTSDVQQAAEMLARALANQNKSQPLDAEAVRAIVRKELSGVPPTVITLRNPDGVELGRVEGHQHPAFKDLVQAATARMADGFHPNVWIYGPPGSGKSTGAKMLAKLLGRPFFFNGPISMEHQLIGWRDGMGNLHEVPLTEAYGQAAVYCFDDVDKCPTFDPFLSLQAALANGHAAFAKGIVQRHVDSLLCATGNTIGKATADFSSTNIDAAFLDRFAVKLFWDYDETLERNLYGAEAAEMIQYARRVAREKGFTGLFITPRATAAAQALLAAGFSKERVKDLTYRATLSSEQRNLMP